MARSRLSGALIVAAVLFLLGELVVRLLVVGEVSWGWPSSVHGHLGNEFSDDTPYRLALKRDASAKNPVGLPDRFHPTFGWTAQPITADNPLGIVSDSAYVVDSLRGQNLLLFLGDGFVQGATDNSSTIPALVGARFRDLQTLNLGVGSYGLDQMYLRMMSVIDLLESPHVVIGVLLDDIDRVVFELHEWPKPYFVYDGTDLHLEGVPIPASYEQWLEAYPPKRMSYLLGATTGMLRRVMSTRWASEYLFRFHPMETAGKRDEKKAITAALIQRIKQATDQRGARLTFLLFPRPVHMIHEGWQEIFLRDVFAALEIDYVNMREPLQTYLEDNTLTWWRDLYPIQNHPDAKENAAMSAYVARHLERRYGYVRTDVDR